MKAVLGAGNVDGGPGRTTTMAEPPGEATRNARCVNCGFEAPAGDEWETVEHPPLGTVPACPECGSTDVLGRR